MLTEKSSAKSAKPQKPIFKLEENLRTSQRFVRDEYKQNKHKTFQCIFFVCYDLDCLKAWLQHQQPDSWAYICHDRDYNEKGELKPVHYHCLARHSHGMRLLPLSKAFRPTNVVVEVPRNVESCREYLTHENNPEKTHYNTDEVVSFTSEGHRSLFTSKAEYAEHKHAEFLRNLSTKTRQEMALIYGRDYMLNYTRYENFLAQIESDKKEREFLESEGEYSDLSVINELGLDLSDYIATANADLLEFLNDKLSDIDSLIDLECLRSLLLEYHRYAIQQRSIYIHRKLGGQ